MRKAIVKNEHGIDVVKCCASCIYNAGVSKNNRVRRLCSNGEGDVRPSDLCRSWVMKPELDNAGIGGGPVKRKAYIDYVSENIMKMSLHEMRTTFEKDHGSRISF